MRLINTLIALVFMWAFYVSCRDNYTPGAILGLISILVFAMYRIALMDNSVLRREKDRGREILTELYDKYE